MCSRVRNCIAQNQTHVRGRASSIGRKAIPALVASSYDEDGYV